MRFYATKPPCPCPTRSSQPWSNSPRPAPTWPAASTAPSATSGTPRTSRFTVSWAGWKKRAGWSRSPRRAGVVASASTVCCLPDARSSSAGWPNNRTPHPNATHSWCACAPRPQLAQPAWSRTSAAAWNCTGKSWRCTRPSRHATSPAWKKTAHASSNCSTWC